MTKAPRRAGRPFRDVEEAAEAVRAGGLRLSSARRAVLSALFAAPGPVTAEEIADGLGGKVMPSEISSVYRNLERFEELGIVRHLHAGHGPGRYVREHGADQGFLVCEGCGEITTLEDGRLQALREGIRASSGFEADLSHFPVVGRCERCAAA